MKSTNRFHPVGTLGTIALLLTAAPAGAAVLQVNLSQSGAPSESGFTNWEAPPGASPTFAPPQTTTINGYGLTATGNVSDVTNNGFRSIDRAPTYTGTLANLTQTWWGARAGATATGGAFTIGISGLAAGDYEWTSWHHDHDNQKGLMTIALSVNGGTTFTNMLTNFAVVSGDTTSAPNPASFDFTANGTQDVLVRFTNTSLNGGTNDGTFVLVNGFQIVPEPSSALLVGMGLLALLRRRRSGNR